MLNLFPYLKRLTLTRDGEAGFTFSKLMLIAVTLTAITALSVPALLNQQSTQATIPTTPAVTKTTDNPTRIVPLAVSTTCFGGGQSAFDVGYNNYLAVYNAPLFTENDRNSWNTNGLAAHGMTAANCLTEANTGWERAKAGVNGTAARCSNATKAYRVGVDAVTNKTFTSAPPTVTRVPYLQANGVVGCDDEFMDGFYTTING